MPDVLVRNVSQRTLKALKARAAQSGRSLQQELLLGFERMALSGGVNPVELAHRIRKRLAQSRGKFSNSTRLIRADRRR